MLRGTGLLGIVAVLLNCLATDTGAAERCELWLARLVSAEGGVEINRAGAPAWQAVSLNEIFCPGDTVWVHKRSRAAILMRDGTTMRLDEGTTLTLLGTEPEQRSWVDLLRGAVHFLSRVRRTLGIKTPFVNAAVEGTEFIVRVGPAETQILVFEGRILARNAHGSLTLASGQAAVARAGEAPQRRVFVRPRDAVQWALYYPPILRSVYRTVSADAVVEKALDRYRQSDLPGAFAALDEVPARRRDAGYFVLRAGLLMTVGRVDEARSDLAQALQIDPKNGNAFALQSIIAVVQNRKEEALQLAEQAVELSPRAPVSHLALSYAYQASFQIEKALESVQEAVSLDPEDAFSRARLAELWLSLGNLDRALAVAREAVRRDPSVARTQTVLGFAHLTRIELIEASAAFEKAIELDQADPLPRLGLGLAKIRQNDLAEGRQEIEIAASLDPNNALVRSYLGKAYYEEKRTALAAEGFTLAKALDPNDPTPYFYDAILKQTINRPVEALHDMQKAIELNDNRAVYRSSLLLDQDLAARSASLARIYTDLGFERLALAEGWKSVSADPTNHSAHRFLADAYATQPRHEIARVSELLQAQLLQPLNINPVQPQMVETNLAILEGAGPGAAGFNEYTPLFARNRVLVQASGLAGSNSTVGDEVVVGGIQGKVSSSLGQFHFETDGFRENNDLEQDIYDVFGQASVSPKLGLQAEVRRRDTEHGDLGLRFDPEGLLLQPSFRREETSETVRLGARYHVAQHSELIMSAIHGDVDSAQGTKLGDFERESKSKDDASIGEAQYLFRTQSYDLVVGGSYYEASLDRSVLTTVGDSANSDRVIVDTTHSNGYLYVLAHYPSSVAWTLGLSFDELDDSRFGKSNEFNPKFGLLWDVTHQTTLRVAAFKVLKRNLIADQTVEPTQVAGFNQFFDDLNGTVSRRFGIGIEHQFSSNVYGGVELSRRELQVPMASLTMGNVTDEWEEELYRGYLYYTPNRRVSLSAEYQLEIFDLSGHDIWIAPDTTTHIFPVTLAYFYPSGLFSRLRATYVKQEVDFVGADPYSDQFGLVDGIIGYRLPMRSGTLRVEVRNLFNQNFDFQWLEARSSQELRDPPFFPERNFFLSFTLVF